MNIKDFIQDLDAMASQQTTRFVMTHHMEDVETADEENEAALTYEQFLTEQGEQGLKSLTGLTKAQFEEVYEVVKEKLEPHGRGRRKSFLPINQLFLTLVWIQTGLKYSKLSAVFRISITKIQRIIIDSVIAIADTLYNRYIIKKVQRSQGEKKFQHFPEAVGACDVALLFINKPTKNDVQKLYYSSKHKTHGIKLQAIVNPDGLCFHTDISQAGHVHDKKVFDC